MMLIPPGKALEDGELIVEVVLWKINTVVKNFPYIAYLKQGGDINGITIRVCWQTLSCEYFP